MLDIRDFLRINHISLSRFINYCLYKKDQGFYQGTITTIRATVRSNPHMAPCGLLLRSIELELAAGQDEVLL